MNDEDISVLLVDDQRLFREGVKVIIDAQTGMSVVGSAGDGAQAVRLVDELGPDVVLMDIRMPRVDGVEATRQIFSAERTSRRDRPVRVIVLTTFNLDDRAATAIRLGASGFLLKDTTPLMLRDAIRTVHTGNGVIAPADLSTLMAHQLRSTAPAPPAYLELTVKEREIFHRRRPWLVQLRDRRAGVRPGIDGQDPRRSSAAKACPARPRSNRGVRTPAWADLTLRLDHRTRSMTDPPATPSPAATGSQVRIRRC